jgi:hypothetical protein
MLCDKNESLESRNFIDGVNFTKDDPCIFVTYPAGAAGDLLISIIDKHYIRTGCEYYGIADNGRVHMFTADYESMDLHKNYEFNNQWFWDLAENLGNRNLNYSLLDQVIFGCHMYNPEQTQYILDTFPNAKIININAIDKKGNDLLTFLRNFKLRGQAATNSAVYQIPDKLIHERVLNLPFGFMFNEESYNKYYQQIIDFLDLNGRLICFDYIKYYLSKQHPEIRDKLVEYSKTL